MSQTESNHLTPDTPPAVLNGRRIGDTSRVFSKPSLVLERVEENHHASCEVAALCTRFLAQMSHRMRTHLGSIISATEMMHEVDLTDAHKEFVATTAESAKALALMTEEIADFARCLAFGAGSLAHPSEPGGNQAGETASLDNSRWVNPEPQPASAEGVEDMLSKTPAGGNRAFDRSPIFRTRIPPDTAKLIRILVAEDHLMNQQVMLRMLARLGFRADAVGNGAEAVAALQRSPYDLVLMDCQMPELDGYEATRQIRRSGGRFQSTPIIAVTANAMLGDREKCLASGMSDYMSKPVLAQTLATTLERWILPDAATAAAGPAPSPPATPSSAPLPAHPGQETSQSRSGDAATNAAENVPENAAGNVADEIGDAVDAGALETLRSIDAGDEGFMTKIIELFLWDLTERVSAITLAAENRDGAALKSIAHALKGSCGHFGAARLAALCRTLEQIGARESAADPREAVRSLVAEADRVRIALEAVEEDLRKNSVTMEESD
jgi:CheY-like chemotaxis protein/HPt (histidine-containing phosphotransfer) domain-containing protein